MSRDLPKFVRFVFFYSPRRRVGRHRRRRRLIEMTGQNRSIVKGRAARPLYYRQVVAPRWRPSSHRARRRRRSSRSPPQRKITERPSCCRASSRGKWILLRLHSRSRSRRRRRRRCFVRLRRRAAWRQRANGLCLNLSGSRCCVLSERLAWMQSWPIAHSYCTEAATMAQKGLGRGGAC